MVRPASVGPGPRKVDTSEVSYAAWVSVADLSASKSSGARRLHQECRLREVSQVLFRLSRWENLEYAKKI